MDKNHVLHSIFYNFVLPLQSSKIAQSIKTEQRRNLCRLQQSPEGQLDSAKHTQGEGHQLSLVPISKYLATSSESQLESAGHTSISEEEKGSWRELRIFQTCISKGLNKAKAKI